MTTEEITVRVDAQVASAYRSASEEMKNKLDLLVSLRLRDATDTAESLDDVIGEMRRRAAETGLTEEMLEQILSDE